MTVLSSAAWARWRAEFAKACARSHYTLESLEAALEQRRAHLWAGDEAALVVEFHTFPAGARCCLVRWAAGGVPAILQELDKLEAEARALGCTEMEIDARPGWGRLVRNRGYRPWSAAVRKEL